MGIRLLGDIPLHPQICHDADMGKPTVVASQNGPQSEAFSTITQDMLVDIGLKQ